MRRTRTRTKTFGGLGGALLIASALAACAGSPRALPAAIELPVANEPGFEPLQAPPTDATGVAAADIRTALTRRFAALASARASLEPMPAAAQEWIQADGAAYRRLHYYYRDDATYSQHGACGQNLYVWVSPQGRIVATYVQEMTCPI